MNGGWDTRTVEARGWPVAVLLVGLSALMMALAGPFGQAERFLPSHRLGLWLLYLTAALPVLYGVQVALRGWVRGGILRMGLSALVGSVPILLVVEGIGLVEGRPLPRTGFDWLRAYMEVAVLAAPFAVLLDRFFTSARGPESPSDTVSLDRFGDIYAVRAEGHYSRLFTAGGEVFLDTSFSVLLKSLESRAGAQVHRSWWVARDAIEERQRQGSSAVLIVKGGIRVPVARRRLSRLRNM